MGTYLPGPKEVTPAGEVRLYQEDDGTIRRVLIHHDGTTRFLDENRGGQAEGAVAGAVLGAMVGALFGPEGAWIGGILGGLLGAKAEQDAKSGR